MPEPFWSVCRTLHLRESFAAERLRERGYATFLPHLRRDKRITPLFNGYLFVAIVDRWREIDSTLGVLRLVRFGDCPARVPEREIAALRARLDADGFIVLPPPPSARRRVYAKGTKLKILGGPFASFNAIHSGMSVKEREIVLIVMLGGQQTIAVPAHQLQPAVSDCRRAGNQIAVKGENL
jgi:transcriptional antiterminator RfaH